jgi:hypothetical protein
LTCRIAVVLKGIVLFHDVSMVKQVLNDLPGCNFRSSGNSILL